MDGVMGQVVTRETSANAHAGGTRLEHGADRGPDSGPAPGPDPGANPSPGDAPAPGPDREPPAVAPSSRPGNPVPPARVAAMFDEIAPVYDRMNTLMTLGLDGRWRRAAVAAAHISPGGAVIDVACGTGKLAAALAERVGPFGRVLAVDLAPGMIDEARRQNLDL